MGRGPLLILALCAALALAVAGCGSDDSSTTGSSSADSSATGSTESSDPAATTDKGEEELPRNADTSVKPEITIFGGEPPKELETVDLVKGTGAEAKPGDEVTVQYLGANFKTGKEFDASWDRGEPFTFTLGGGEVIAGWDQGIEGMKVGTRRELFIPPKLGYGASGSPPSIPPNETLIFIVDLLAVN